MPYRIKQDSHRDGVFLFPQPAAVSSCLHTWTFPDLQTRKTPLTSLFFLFSVTFLTFVFHPSFQTHRGRSAPDGCPKAESVEAAAALQRAAPVIMGCLGLQGGAGRNACTCVCLSYLAFHTCSLCLSVSARQNHPFKVEWRLQECSH